MSIQSQIDRLKGNVTSAYTAVNEKGGSVPALANSANLPAAIRSIQTGVDTSDATAEDSDVLFGKTAYAKEKKITGSLKIPGYYWTQVTYNDWGIDKNPINIFYVDGKFIALVSGNASIFGYYSMDGTNWTMIPNLLTTRQYWQYITYGNGTFVATSRGAYLAYSTDGINWKLSNIPTDYKWGAVTYGNGKFVVVCENKAALAYSANGISWTVVTTSTNSRWTGISYGNGRFVVVARGGSGDVGPIAPTSTAALYSLDGIKWTTTTMPVARSWRSVAYGSGKFVATAYNSDIAAYSVDGVEWTTTTMPFLGGWWIVRYEGGRFVVTDMGYAEEAPSNKAACSYDGINWFAVTLPFDGKWYNICYTDGTYLATSTVPSGYGAQSP